MCNGDETGPNSNFIKKNWNWRFQKPKELVLELD